MMSKVHVGKNGRDWFSHCAAHSHTHWGSDWEMVMEAAYGHIAMHHHEVCS